MPAVKFPENPIPLAAEGVWETANREIGGFRSSIDMVMSGRDLSDAARAAAFFLPAQAKGLMQRLHGFFHSA